MGEIGDFKSGSGFPESEQGGKDGTPFYKVSDMNLDGNESYMTVANNYVTDSQVKRLKLKPINDSSIIFAKVGAAVFLERKRIAQRFLIDNNMMAFTPRKSISFIRLLFENIRLSKYAQAGALPSYNASDLKTIRVSHPGTEEEQQKIADFLTAVDKRIQQLEEKKRLLTEYKKGVMQQIFSQQIRFTDDNGQPYPDWEEKRLGDLCECLDNQRVPLNETQRSTMKGEIPYWGANNIMDYINDYIFDEPLILLAEDGGYFDEFQTRPIANISYGKCWVNNHAHILRAKAAVLTEYIYLSLVHKNILGYVNTGTRAKLNKGDMLKIPLHVPSVKEQQKIADFLMSISNKIEQVALQHEQAKSFKKGLLQQMFV